MCGSRIDPERQRIPVWVRRGEGDVNRSMFLDVDGLWNGARWVIRQTTEAARCGAQLSSELDTNWWCVAGGVGDIIIGRRRGNLAEKIVENQAPDVNKS